MVADSEPGEMVQVRFEEEFDEASDTHQFQEADLEKIEDQTLPGE